MQKYELHTQVVPGVNLSFWWRKEEKGCPNTNIQGLHIHVLKPATPGSACWTSQPLTSGSVFRLCGESGEKRVRVTVHRSCAWAGEGPQFTWDSRSACLKRQLSLLCTTLRIRRIRRNRQREGGYMCFLVSFWLESKARNSRNR